MLTTGYEHEVLVGAGFKPAHFFAPFAFPIVLSLSKDAAISSECF